MLFSGRERPQVRGMRKESRCVEKVGRTRLSGLQNKPPGHDFLKFVVRFITHVYAMMQVVTMFATLGAYIVDNISALLRALVRHHSPACTGSECPPLDGRDVPG